MDKDQIFGWAYMVIALATFAWSASDPAHKCEPHYIGNDCFERMDRTASGFAAGVAWPLYWVWTGAEYIRGTDHAE